MREGEGEEVLSEESECISGPALHLRNLSRVSSTTATQTQELHL